MRGIGESASPAERAGAGPGRFQRLLTGPAQISTNSALSHPRKTVSENGRWY